MEDQKEIDKTNNSIFRSYPIYWIYGKLRSNIQPYIDDTFDASQIIKNLWVGAISSSSNKKNMKSHNIKMIVSAHVGGSALFPYDFEYKLIELLDISNENIIDCFEKILPAIYDVISRDYGVLVHCMMGASRSVTIVAAYLIKYHNMTTEKSIKYMKKIREEVDPNPGYIKQLKLYENHIKNNVIVNNSTINIGNNYNDISNNYINNNNIKDKKNNKDIDINNNNNNDTSNNYNNNNNIKDKKNNKDIDINNNKDIDMNNDKDIEYDNDIEEDNNIIIDDYNSDNSDNSENSENSDNDDD